MNETRKKKQSGVLHRLRAKTQSQKVHLTTEDDWDTEVPNVRLSRVFSIVLLLHVVAVGGILAFQLLSKDEDVTPGSEVVGNVQPAAVNEIASVENTPPVGGTKRPVIKIDDPAFDGLRHYRVQSGDSLMSIARRFQVPVDELEHLNQFDAGNKLYPGLILFLPTREIRAQAPAELQRIASNQQSGTAEPNNKREKPEARVPVAVRDGFAAVSETAPKAIPASNWGASIAVEEPELVGASVNSQAAKDLEIATVLSNNVPAAVVSEAPVPVAIPVVQASLGAAPIAVPAKTVATNVRGIVKIYTVQPGDTAYALGRKFGIGHEELLKINGVADARGLKVGLKLKVPVTQ
ncbi:MAG: LysM peptidoglycan-binding domain-containing protein [Verrucomicrobiales bacterium]|nr:LysM peptidoglycan-binding domain-containing protein [Verrucomicrobiales bacterium]